MKTGKDCLELDNENTKKPIIVVEGKSDVDKVSKIVDAHFVITNGSEISRETISYLQRRLSIGYNKAAGFIERMEQDGIVSAPDANNKRHIL